MVAQLTKNERQLGLIISVLVALLGLAMAAAGKQDLLGIHGLIVAAFGVGSAFLVISGYHLPEPTKERLASYYDDPIKVGLVLAMLWAVFGLFMGVWVASLLACLVQLRTDPAHSHDRGNLRLRW